MTINPTGVIIKSSLNDILINNIGMQYNSTKNRLVVELLHSYTFNIRMSLIIKKTVDNAIGKLFFNNK